MRGSAVFLPALLAALMVLTTSATDGAVTLDTDTISGGFGDDTASCSVPGDGTNQR